MKAIFLLGGFAGFITGGAASLWVDHRPERVFFDAAVGCLCSAVLFRWFWAVVVQGIRETLLQKQAAASAPAKSK